MPSKGGSALGGSSVRLDGEHVGDVSVDVPVRFAVRDGPKNHQVEVLRSVSNWWGRFWIDIKVDGEYVVQQEKLVSRPD